MGVYHYSACHDCKEQTMWPKTTEEQAEKWHVEFAEEHKDHETELGNDYDDDFYDKIWNYQSKVSDK